MEELKAMTLRQKPRLKKWVYVFLAAIAITVLAVVAFKYIFVNNKVIEPPPFSYKDVPEYTGKPSYEVNGGVPYFGVNNASCLPYERYSDLDALGRCGPAMACLCEDLMPKEERGNIGMLKPSGWHTTRYDDLIEGKYLYNRCHLIAYMLSGENENDKNLITGARYFNVSGMLTYEIMVADYIVNTRNHVLYRVTPVFVGSDLLARGVLMEAYSVEDNGQGVQFNAFVYNVQPGIDIDYSTGYSGRAN